jgi:alpha-1,6-mannosyltransferase
MLLDTLVLLSIMCYVIICPYTKVEESFNMQAIYDILHFGSNIQSYDHLQFPGVVPRTFIGALIVSLFSAPGIFGLQSFGFHGIHHQIMVRIILGMITWSVLVRFRKAVQSAFNKRTAQIFMILTAIQFHFCFYASRTLPNTFAVILSLVSFSLWFEVSSIQYKFYDYN